jgi:hypothetical protein
MEMGLEIEHEAYLDYINRTFSREIKHEKASCCDPDSGDCP